jgi:hypothetical protein
MKGKKIVFNLKKHNFRAAPFCGQVETPGKPRTRKLVNPRTLKTKEKAPAESKRFSPVNALENPWERKKKTFFLKNFYLFLFKIEKF